MIKKKQKNYYRPLLGELMKEVIEKQKQIIRETCYNCVEPSDKEVGEILAKKLIENKLI